MNTRTTVGIVGVVITFASFAMAQGQGIQNKTQAAEAAAASWLQLVDSGQYAQSWKEAASVFKATLTEQQWVEKLKQVMQPLGARTSRRLKSAEYKTELPGVPDGQYVVIQYDSSFAHKKSAVETVVPMMDRDGKWRVSGYFIR